MTIRATVERVSIGSAFAERGPSGNVRIGLTHSESQRGGGLLHGPTSDVVIERADVSDMIWALRLLTGDGA